MHKISKKIKVEQRQRCKDNVILEITISKDVTNTNIYLPPTKPGALV